MNTDGLLLLLALLDIHFSAKNDQSLSRQTRLKKLNFLKHEYRILGSAMLRCERCNFDLTFMVVDELMVLIIP